MIFIERGVDEAICVGDTIVRVLEVRGGEARLAISSPGNPRYREVVLQCRSSDDDLTDMEACDESLSFFA
jgi:sRNA-binding carbon storage regulator CsrA